MERQTESYPCPLAVNVADSIKIKLCLSNYYPWKQQMLTFLARQDLSGFVNGSINPPNNRQALGGWDSWESSDGLVRRWILATVTGGILLQVMHLRTAREVWIKLEKILTPCFQLHHLELIDWKDQKMGEILSHYVKLHKAIITGDWSAATEFLNERPDAVGQPITWRLETALIMAIRSANRNCFVKNLMERMAQENVELLEKQDISGATALHAAVGGGNIVAAKQLVELNPRLANIADKYGTLPVHVAAVLEKKEIVQFLFEKTRDLSEDESGPKLLHSLVSSGFYDIALNFLQQNPKLATMEPSSLVAIAQNRTSFRSGTSLDPDSFDNVTQRLNKLVRNVAEKLVPGSRSIRYTRETDHGALSLFKCLCKSVVENDFPNAAEIFREPLRIATCLGIHEIVEEILVSFPSAIHLRNEMNQSLFHQAVMYRRANIFNLIYQMEEDHRALLSTPDVSGNNVLHLVGNLEAKHLILLRASGLNPAQQMQRELYWFKEVEKWILPQAKEHLNADGKTSRELFTDTHNDLVKEAEKWMKGTAKSCAIVFALVITIVFAAAITVPGGFDSDKGLPIRLGNVSFTIFGICDLLAMFTSSSSLFVFMSILTCSYREEDFMVSLIKRMIIGQANLFLSVLFTMMAFVSACGLVFGEGHPHVFGILALIASVPMFQLTMLLYPLLLSMTKSTYFSSIFQKQSDRIFR